MNNKLIIVSGNISSGKTTFAEFLAANMNIDVYYEPYIDNPYLNLFYENMNEWSFKSQIYFLTQHYMQHIDISGKIEKSLVKDCSIYESVEVYGRNMFLEGNMTEVDWNTYYMLYKELIKTIRKPDLIVKLNCPIDELKRRIKLRGRDMEKNIQENYLKNIDGLYNNWINNIEFSPVLQIDSCGSEYYDQGILEKIKHIIS